MPPRDSISAGFGTEYLGGLSNEVRIHQPSQKLKGTEAAKPQEWLSAHPDTGRYPNHKLVDIQPSGDTIDLIYEAIPTTPKIEESIDAELGIVKKYTYRNKYGATLPTIGATAINSLTLTSGDYVHRAAENLIGGMMAEVSVAVVSPASSPTRDRTEINDIYGSYTVYEKFVRNADVTLLAKGATYSGSSIVLNDELIDIDGTFGTRKTTTIILANCPLRVSKITDKDYGYVYQYDQFGLSSRSLNAIGSAFGIGTVLDAQLVDNDGTFSTLRQTVLPSTTGTSKKSQDIDKIFCVSSIVEKKVPVGTTLPQRGTLYTSGTASGYVLDSSISDSDGTHATITVKLASSNQAAFREYKLDGETGKIYTETTTYQLGGTQPSGQAVNANAEFTETKRIDCNFYVSTTSKTTTLTTESVPVVVPSMWPAVLLAFSINPLYDNDNKVSKYMVDFELKKRYVGHCRGLETRSWSVTQPPAESVVTLIEEALVYQGIFIDFSIPSCLHYGINIYENTGTEHPLYRYTTRSKSFAATPYTAWPSSLVQDCNVSRYKGGWLKEVLRVYAPT